jgi:hypothetical protein
MGVPSLYSAALQINFYSLAKLASVTDILCAAQNRPGSVTGVILAFL